MRHICPWKVHFSENNTERVILKVILKVIKSVVLILWVSWARLGQLLYWVGSSFEWVDVTLTGLSKVVLSRNKLVNSCDFHGKKTYLIGRVGFRSWSRIYHFWANIVAGLNPVWKRGYSVLNFGVVGRYLENSISDVTCIIKSLYILRSSNVRGRSPPECGSGHSACTRVGNTTVWPEGIVEMMMWRHLLTPNLSVPFLISWRCNLII